MHISLNHDRRKQTLKQPRGPPWAAAGTLGVASGAVLGSPGSWVPWVRDGGPECHLEGPEWVGGADSDVRAAASPCFSMLSGGGCLGALSTGPVPPRAGGFPSPRRPPAYPSGRGGTGQPPPPSPTPAPQFRVCRLNLFHLSARHLRRRIDAFELWCWRRLLRVFSNTSV